MRHNTEMLSPLEVLQYAGSEQFFGEDGESFHLQMLPGLDDEAVRSLESIVGAGCPPEIRDLLRVARGFVFEPVGEVRFDRGFSFDMKDLLPRATPLCSDGFGNWWVASVEADGRWGPILFVNHDPPVLAVQSNDLATFLDGILSLGRDPRGRALDAVRDESCRRIWEDEPWGARAGDLGSAQDPVMRSFVDDLPETDMVFDLRKREVGSGFAWGRGSHVNRHPSELIFSRSC